MVDLRPAVLSARGVIHRAGCATEAEATPCREGMHLVCMTASTWLHHSLQNLIVCWWAMRWIKTRRCRGRQVGQSRSPGQRGHWRCSRWWASPLRPQPRSPTPPAPPPCPSPLAPPSLPGAGRQVTRCEKEAAAARREKSRHRSRRLPRMEKRRVGPGLICSEV